MHIFQSQWNGSKYWQLKRIKKHVFICILSAPLQYICDERTWTYLWLISVTYLKCVSVEHMYCTPHLSLSLNTFKQCVSVEQICIIRRQIPSENTFPSPPSSTDSEGACTWANPHCHPLHTGSEAACTWANPHLISLTNEHVKISITPDKRHSANLELGGLGYTANWRISVIGKISGAKFKNCKPITRCMKINLKWTFSEIDGWYKSNLKVFISWLRHAIGVII